jgi:hypothetical protein
MAQFLKPPHLKEYTEMPEIFGFDQDELFRELAKVLKEVEKKQKVRDRDGPPPIIGPDPDTCVARYSGVAKGGEASRLEIYASLVGTSQSTIDVRITIK